MNKHVQYRFWDRPADRHTAIQTDTLIAILRPLLRVRSNTIGFETIGGLNSQTFAMPVCEIFSFDPLSLISWLVNLIDVQVFDCRPRILTQSGHLIFQTAENHNITFRPSTGGTVVFDGQDLRLLIQQVSHTLHHARYLFSYIMTSWTFFGACVPVFIMVALCNRADHYIFILFLLLWSPYGIGRPYIFSSCFFFFLLFFLA